MNLFRSEEHVQSWSQYNPDSSEGIMPLEDWVALFSTESRRNLLSGQYISRWLPVRGRERDEVLERLDKTGPFWVRSP